MAAKVVGFVVIVCLCLITLDGWRSWNARAVQLQEMNVATANLARAMAQQADDTFKEADVALVGIAERVRTDGTSEKALQRLHGILVLRQQELPQLNGLFVYDENGNWIATSASVPLKKFNNADRAYFIFHRTHADLGLHIGTPVISRSSGKYVIPLSRRFDRPDGSFGGVVLATVDVDFFKSFYSTLDVGQSGAVALVLDNGTMLLRRPYDVKTIGKDVTGTELYRSFSTHGPVGTAFIQSAQDGITRLNSYRNLEHYPAFVAAALSKDEILREWWHDTLWHSAGVLLIVIVVGAVGWSLAVQVKRRALAESALREARDSLEKVNAVLEKLATQDGLTGLANRRKFDVTLAEELGRARRQGEVLALIMLDVDYFKQYNDIYGHVAGDMCLKSIGQLMLGLAARRAGELSARYGGEELAVLLPGTDMAHALKLAEHLRVAVAGLQIQHTGSAEGVITVSAGVAATSTLTGAIGPTDLVEAADHALYEAKRRGRNRVVAATDVPLALERETNGGSSG
jgi:diguanylate cyclase (GGDEF)-like protein